MNYYYLASLTMANDNGENSLVNVHIDTNHDMTCEQVLGRAVKAAYEKYPEAVMLAYSVSKLESESPITRTDGINIGEKL